MRSLMFRRLTPSLPLTATSVQVRAVAFAGQSTDLQSITNERGYDSPMWIAVEDDKWWYGRLTAPKANAKPIKVMVAKRLELFNEDQLKSPLGQTPAESHSSLLTQKPYKGPMLKELEQRALIHDYQSKWWLTPNAVRQRNLYLKPRARPHAILIRVPTEVLHVSDFQNADALLQHPLAGDTGRPLMNDIGATLTAAMNERPSKLKAPVWFTSTSLTDMQLDPAPGAQTVTSVSSEVATYYNLESFEKSDQLLATAPADYLPDPSNPRYLTTGSTITSKHIAEALSKSGHAHSLWMTSKDLEFKQRGATGDLFKLKPNAPSVSLPAFTATWFFVDDMANPAAALKAFGTHTR